jgi:hypothetical protein
VTAAEQGLAQRRQELVERSTAQRAALIASSAPLLEKAATLDRIVESVRRHPVISGAVVGAVVLMGSRRFFDLATRALTLYALLRR